ncbi:MAG: septum formation initiator family protein [Hyphomicrobium sp.]|nr:septum formation initiator family protein [Hyphomicrobium sp.]
MRLRQTLVLLLCLAATAYFTHHAIYGRHGLLARSKLIERTDLVEFEIRSLETVRSKLSNDVALLAKEPADPDLVDEIARDVLGYVRPDDKILGTP